MNAPPLWSSAHTILPAAALERTLRRSTPLFSTSCQMRSLVPPSRMVVSLALMPCHPRQALGRSTFLPRIAGLPPLTDSATAPPELPTW